jgi:hypothetical protein
VALAPDQVRRAGALSFDKRKYRADRELKKDLFIKIIVSISETINRYDSRSWAAPNKILGV